MRVFFWCQSGLVSLFSQPERTGVPSIGGSRPPVQSTGLVTGLCPIVIADDVYNRRYSRNCSPPRYIFPFFHFPFMGWWACGRGSALTRCHTAGTTTRLSHPQAVRLRSFFFVTVGPFFFFFSPFPFSRLLLFRLNLCSVFFWYYAFRDPHFHVEGIVRFGYPTQVFCLYFLSVHHLHFGFARVPLVSAPKARTRSFFCFLTPWARPAAACPYSL